MTTPNHGWLIARRCWWRRTSQLRVGSELKQIGCVRELPDTEDYQLGYLAAVALRGWNLPVLPGAEERQVRRPPGVLAGRPQGLGTARPPRPLPRPARGSRQHPPLQPGDRATSRHVEGRNPPSGVWPGYTNFFNTSRTAESTTAASWPGSSMPRGATGTRSDLPEGHECPQTSRGVRTPAQVSTPSKKCSNRIARPFA